MLIYNITGTESPEISATKFINKLPNAVRSAAKHDPNGGDVLYDRLRDLEAAGATIDVREQSLINGVNYAKEKLGLSAELAEMLIGTTVVPERKRVYRLETVSGVLNDWIDANRKPSDAPYTRTGEIVEINGTLPLQEAI